MDTRLLRNIPKVDELLRDPALEAAAAGLAPKAVTRAVREELEALRGEALAGRLAALPARDELCRRAAARARRESLPSLRGVINGSGVVLHTNLGRACLSERAARAAYEAARRYSTLEYDVATGGRGLRYAHVEGLLCRVTGAEAALVVNNNAAAVLLVLSELAAGGEVVTSRGELVEIGGSFRVPEIMEACGCRLREVGTTNKTRLRDYERAIGPETRALMKVHTSNFRIVGFTEEAPLAALVALGRERGLPVVEDLGSGALLPAQALGLGDEPTAPEAIAAGVDVVTFSGDKLLGGPQAGVILGRRAYIDRFKRHPLTRAMRVDKMTLAALEATLRSYDEELAEAEVPTLAMLRAAPEALRARAALLCERLRARGVACELAETEGQVGGGSAPTRALPSFAAAVAPGPRGADALEARLRQRERPVIGRIVRDRFLLDARTLRDDELEELAAAVEEALA